MTVRTPAVAGMFYPADPSALRRQIESCFLGKCGPGRLPTVNPSGERHIVGLICPHAGYMYSGGIASCAYDQLASDGLPDVAVILGPNHRSYLPEVAVTQDDRWATPLGAIEVDMGINDAIMAAFPTAKRSSLAHQEEHSLEVQIPFLQYLSEIGKKSIKIVPLLLGNAALSDPESFIEGLSKSIADSLSGKSTVIIASSDFTHYQSRESAAENDSRAISSIISVDEAGLVRIVKSYGITMCGVLPTAVAIAACKKMGTVRAEELAYGNSGDVTGDYSEVVGYGAIKISRQES